MFTFRRAFLFTLIIAIYYRLPPITSSIINNYLLYLLVLLDKHFYFLIFPVIAFFLLKRNLKEFRKIFYKNKTDETINITLASFFFFISFHFIFLIILYSFVTLIDFSIPNIESKKKSYLDVIYLLVISPVFEEFFFRSLLAENFFNRYGFKKAVIYSAFLFMIIHNNFSSWLSIFILGLLLGYIYIYI